MLRQLLIAASLTSVLLTPLLASAQGAGAEGTTGLVSVIVSQSPIQAHLVSGFTEDGFTGPAASCYVGKIEKVCDLIATAEARIRHEYREGAHGYFEVSRCEAKGDEVKLSYVRVTDYDHGPSAPIEMKIGRCL